MPNRNRRVQLPEKAAPEPPSTRDHNWRVAVSRLRELSMLGGGRAVEVVATLIAMAWVERRYGASGLGIYSYIYSLYFIASRFAAWGLPQYVERETAFMAGEGHVPDAVLLRAFQAMLILGVAAALFLAATSVYDTAHTRIEEKAVAYVLAALALPLHSVNRLRLALLNGLGRHEEAARLHALKHLVTLGSIWFLLSWRVQPSYLIGSFLLGEFFLALSGRKRWRLPSIRSLPRNFRAFGETVKEGSRFVFTEDPIGTILFIDMLILGFFISSRDLGIYAEASALARVFLLLPSAILPLLRRNCCVMVACGDDIGASASVHKTAARLFALHSLLALYLVYFYPSALHLFFKNGGQDLLSFRIFEVLLPGLLFSVSAMVLEPFYEAAGKADSLRKPMLTVLGGNLLLNVYLIPVMGLFGAALATTLSLLLYFVLVGRFPDRRHRRSSGIYLLAGGAAYVACVMVQSLDAGPMLSALLFPIFLGAMLYMIGFLGEETMGVQSEKGGEDRGGREEIDYSQTRGGPGEVQGS